MVVTGAFGVLGAAVARAFARARRAASRCSTWRRSRRRELQAEFGAGATCCSAASTSRDVEATRQAMAATAMRFGGIDVLVNVAGGFRWEKLEDGDVETWDQLYAMNLRTAVVSCKAALPAMLERGRGRIINIGAGRGRARPAPAWARTRPRRPACSG